MCTVRIFSSCDLVFESFCFERFSADYHHMKVLQYIFVQQMSKDCGVVGIFILGQKRKYSMFYTLIFCSIDKIKEKYITF